MLTSSPGAIERTASYEAYGSLTGSSGTATTSLGYDGQYTSTDTQLIYMRARTYDPATAQFLSVDPLASVIANRIVTLPATHWIAVIVPAWVNSKSNYPASGPSAGLPPRPLKPLKNLAKGSTKSGKVSSKARKSVGEKSKASGVRRRATVLPARGLVTS